MSVLRDMRTFCIDIERVERLAGDHEEAVPFFSAETQIGADFGQRDHADALAIRREDMDAVVARAGPASSGPNVAINVSADSV